MIFFQIALRITLVQFGILSTTTMHHYLFSTTQFTSQPQQTPPVDETVLIPKYLLQVKVQPPDTGQVSGAGRYITANSVTKVIATAAKLIDL